MAPWEASAAPRVVQLRPGSGEVVDKPFDRFEIVFDRPLKPNQLAIDDGWGGICEDDHHEWRYNVEVRVVSARNPFVSCMGGFVRAKEDGRTFVVVLRNMLEYEDIVHVRVNTDVGVPTGGPNNEVYKSTVTSADGVRMAAPYDGEIRIAIRRVAPPQGLAVDAAGNLYVVGFVTYALQGQQYAGERDYYAAKFDPTGKRVWLVQGGTQERDELTGVAIGKDGTVWATGFSEGSLAGPNRGASDIVVLGFDPGTGAIRSRQQFGTPKRDEAIGMARDRQGNLYIAGTTHAGLEGQPFSDPRPDPSPVQSDVFLTRLDATGRRVWTRQLGEPAAGGTRLGETKGEALALGPNGDVFVTGTVVGDLDGHRNRGGEAAFLLRYAPDGRRQWTRLYLGGIGQTVAVDGDTVLVFGHDLHFSTRVAGFSTGGGVRYHNAMDADVYIADLLRLSPGRMLAVGNLSGGGRRLLLDSNTGTLLQEVDFPLGTPRKLVRTPDGYAVTAVAGEVAKLVRYDQRGAQRWVGDIR